MFPGACLSCGTIEQTLFGPNKKNSTIQSTPQLKSIRNYVIRPNDQHIVFIVIRAYFSEKITVVNDFD